MAIYTFNDIRPRMGERVLVAPSAVVAGDVEVGDDTSFWFHSVARGDMHWIRVGAGTNVQDGAVLHVTPESHPLSVGSGVVVGHRAVLHGCTVEDNVLIGIGASVLDGAVVESFAQVGAGAVVTPGTVVPSGYLVVGIPARVARPLSDEERQHILDARDRYVVLKDAYCREQGWPFS
jgi:carbonic anhydrase/acetyltransferase-like protein (isoleucine patch superfamily)